MPKSGDTLTVRDGVSFDCPFCGKRVTASAEHSSVMHALPMCTKFVALEPDQFLRAVREALDKRPS